MRNLSEYVVACRRKLHTYAEPSWGEFVTTAWIADELEAAGFDVLLGSQCMHPEFIRGVEDEVISTGIGRAQAAGVHSDRLLAMNGITGCVGVWYSSRPGKTIALRFDIDAVAVQESQCITHRPAREGFISQTDGMMHACGHDGHMAIGLAIARWIQAHQQQLCGTVKLLFQPAEEGVRGARPMAESGIVDDVDILLCTHLSFIARSGEIVLDPTQFLATTKQKVIFRGQAAHAGAQPHLGHNALAASCHATVQMLSIPPHGDGSSRVNIGALHSGCSSNVIPEYAELLMEVRGETDVIRDYMLSRVAQILTGCAQSFQVQVDSTVMGEAGTLQNDAMLVSLLRQIAQKYLPEQTLITQRRFGGSEDATLLIQRVQQKGGQGLYFILGADRNAGHHQAEFDFDEGALQIGIKLFSRILETLLSQRMADTFSV